MDPPVAVMPLELALVLPHAARNAARLPYPAILSTSRRERPRSRASSRSRYGSVRLRDWSWLATRLASLESPIGLLLSVGRFVIEGQLKVAGHCAEYRFGQICQLRSFAFARY